jgi:N-acetylmuramate 1-kinase
MSQSTPSHPLHASATVPSPRVALPPGNASEVIWADPARETLFYGWLADLDKAEGLRPESLRPASADASFRRYLRIDCQHATRIIMDAPPDREDSKPFVEVAQLMTAAGLTVPEVLAWDVANGFLLLSDLGDKTMMQVMDRANPLVNQVAYLDAVDTLISWQLASKPGVLPPYDDALLHRELQLFPDWYLARHRGVQVEGEVKATLDTAFKHIVSQNLMWPSVYVHRDFMPRNLMQGSPPGILDFQDAVYGPITYDIASLMRDAFLTWEEDFVLDITIRYWEKARKAGLPVGDDFGEFYRGVEWMGLQRHLKIAGIFARLTLRDGKLQYLADAPRFIDYIRSTCSRYRELKPLLRLIDRIEGTEAPTGFAYGRVS